MSTPVTPQDFIDAAGKVSDPKVVAGLLAAAEQGEQLEAMQQLNEADNRTQAAYREQIATLNERLDKARWSSEQIATLAAQLATAKREAVEAFVNQVLARLDLTRHDDPICTRCAGDIFAAFDAEMAGQ